MTAGILLSATSRRSKKPKTNLQVLADFVAGPDTYKAANGGTQKTLPAKPVAAGQ